ncbi:type II secretion system protein [Lacticaseibacillus daqingensis]|uniref:type II secretion system protein n=1 Tax=Lacticaseibacillus daqingensis TaxID=2486014 RepID=UPI000F7A395F|nr:type II secretion system protein [Lacticaseibacillus daqingensis]
MTSSSKYGRLARRDAFTLVEALVALGVLASVALLWRPLVRAASTAPGQDAQMLRLYQAQHDLQAYVKDATIEPTSTGQGLVIHKAMKRYELGYYYRLGGWQQLRLTTSDGGYQPVLLDVTEVAFTTVRPNVVAFTWRLQSGLMLEGVLYGQTPG